MAKKNERKNKRSFLKSAHIYHKVNKRTGLYNFMFKNILKLLVILITIIAVIILVDRILDAYGIDFKTTIKHFIKPLRTEFVLLLFFVSESILGWIPPDFFIVWARNKPCGFPYLNVTFLAAISYAGGIVAYRLGEVLRRFPKFNSYVEKKNAQYFVYIKRWGGIVVVMAALFPLPYATISTVAGIVKYPFRNYMLFGLTRFLRFYVYAIWIFWGLNKLI